MEFEDDLRKCSICEEFTYHTRTTHLFLRHQEHRNVYMCRWCTYADLVTDRFQFHLSSVHRRTLDVESCFRPCIVFTTLEECDVRGCNFRTNTREKLHEHMPEHEELMDNPLEGSVQLADLSEDLRALVLRDQRREMGQQSNFNKTVERERGLVSPPLSLQLEVKPRRKFIPRPPPTPTMTSPVPGTQKRDVNLTGFGRGKFHLAQQEEPKRRMGRAQMCKFPHEPGYQPMSSRNKRKNKQGDVEEQLTDEQRRRKIQEEAFRALRDIPRPRRRPMLLPLERVVRRNTHARYIAELTGGHRTFYMLFFELLPVCNALLIQREEEVVSQVTGIVINHHMGSADAYRADDGHGVQWEVRGPMYDVYTRPWSVVRRVQLSSTPPNELYYVLNPVTEVRYATEVTSI